MHFYDKVSIVLMVQGTFDLFCYFNISPEAIYGFEEKYGAGSWNCSKQIIKVKKMVADNCIEIKSKEIDKFETSSFIKLNDDDMDVCVEYGRELFGNEFVSMAISNVVSTPRASKSKESTVSFVDFKNKNVNELMKKELDNETITNEYLPGCRELSTISHDFNKNEANNEEDKRFFEKYFREIQGKYKTYSSK